MRTLPKPDKKFVVLVTNSPRILIVSVILPITCFTTLTIIGMFLTAHATKRDPMKSMILPRNPFVLPPATLPDLFAAPDKDDASMILSCSLLLTASLLFKKVLCATLIEDLLKVFDLFMVLEILLVDA
jgi:hypothetical protein